MRRRDFIQLAAVASSWPLAARAQQAKRTLRIGWVIFTPRSAFDPFESQLAELGYREGENLTWDIVRIADPNKSLVEDAYREIASRNPDILLAWGPEIVLKAALASSQTTPIVMIALDYDPIAHGYVASLARPGGRITGLFVQQIELTVKRLQFFKEAVPDFNSAVVFYDAVSRDQWNAAEAASGKLGLRLSGIDMLDPPYDYDRALAEAPPDNRKNLFMPTSPVFFNDRERLAKFALRNRLSSMFGLREWVDAGGLMSYGGKSEERTGRTAQIIYRIARGARPSDLPIEQPTKFDFVINLSTARALGLELSPTLLARADEVIE
jgi:putative tryptophan/tyrosine transport system substrate-binding protein